MARHIFDTKDKKILRVLKENPEGLRKISLEKLTGVKERTLYNHLKKLEKLKIIKHIFPIYKIWQSSDLPKILAKLSDSNNTQLHKPIWILPLIKKPDWWNKRKDRLMRLSDWVFKSEVTANNNTYHQIENKSMQIQTYKNSIYFICKEYYGKSDFDVFNQSKDDVLEAIRYIEEVFRFKFLAENNFHLTLLDSHYVTLKETLAEQYKKQGDRFLIETKEGYTLNIDFSEPFGLESNNIEVKRRYLRVVKDYQDYPEMPLPSEQYRIQSEIGQNLKIMSDITISTQKDLPIILGQLKEQIKSHLALIQEYRKENVSWRQHKVKEIKDELRYGKQTKLIDFKK